MEALIETRNEYVEHIQDILGIAISKRINKIWEESGNNIKKFQSELTQIKKWNYNIINEEYKKIVKYTKCNYLYNLIKIIIINTIKIKIYEYRDQFDNIKIRIPAAPDYIHKCYMNIATFSWKNAYLFVNKGIKDVEYQNNLNIIEENIKIIIKKTFRDFIPYDEILDQIDESLTDTVSQFKDESDTKNTSPTKSKEIEPEIVEEDESDEDSEEEAEDGEEEAEEDRDDKEEDRILKSEVTFNNKLQPLQEPPKEQTNESNVDTEEIIVVEPVNLFEPMKTQEEFVIDKDNVTNDAKDINEIKSLLPEPIIKEIHISDSQDKKKKLSFF